MKTRVVVVLLFASLFVILARTSAGASDTSKSTDWPAYNGDYASTRYSTLAQITPANVHYLRRSCIFDLGETSNFESSPIVVAGVMHVATFQNTYAVDARTCKLRWKYHLDSATSPVGSIRGLTYS